jgi:hypothetical protein
MPYSPTPKEALLLWHLITAETEDEREPLLSNARPSFTRKQLSALVDAGFVTLETKPGKRGKYLALSEGAWAWAQGATGVELLKSQSSVGAIALQGLLRRLLPYLRERDVPLAELFPSTAGDDRRTGETTPDGSAEPATVPLVSSIERACLALAGGARKTRVRLSALRRELSSIERTKLDHALLALSDEGRLVLYRDDNTAALTADDHRAALMVGGAPRHLVYLET